MKLRLIQRIESLVPIAKAAGIVVPHDLLDESPEFHHWSLFCAIQLERPIPSDDALSHNAAIIAAIPLDHLNSDEFKLEEISSLLK